MYFGEKDRRIKNATCEGIPWLIREERSGKGKGVGNILNDEEIKKKCYLNVFVFVK